MTYSIRAMYIRYTVQSQYHQKQAPLGNYYYGSTGSLFSEIADCFYIFLRTTSRAVS